MELRPHHRGIAAREKWGTGNGRAASLAEPERKEEVLVTGQELILRIRDDAGEWHGFTQYPLGAEQEKQRPEKQFHLLSELVECFHIPAVPDVAQVHPNEFAEYRRRLAALESA